MFFKCLTGSYFLVGLLCSSHIAQALYIVSYIGCSEEIKFISHKYDKADYPTLFIYSIIRQFQDKSNQCNMDDFGHYIIPPNFFPICQNLLS